MQSCRIGFGAAAVGHNNGIAAGTALQVDRCTLRSGAQESGIIAQGVSMVRSLEQMTMRRVYLRILPFAALTYFMCYLDRINVGFAALTMNKVIGLDAAT